MADRLEETDLEALNRAGNMHETRSQTEAIAATGANAIGDTTETVEIIAIRTDIEHTRHDITETLDAIKEKLSPQVLMDQAKEHAKEVAVEAIDHARDAVKDNISATVGNMKDTVSDAVHSASDSVGNVVQNVSDSVSSAVQAAKDKVGDVFGTTKDKVGGMAGSARDSVSNMAQSAPAKIGGIMDGAKGAGGAVLDTVKRNPLPTALIAVGATYLYLKHRDNSNTSGFSGGYRTPDYDYTEYDPMFPAAGSTTDPDLDIVVVNAADGVEASRGTGAYAYSYGGGMSVPSQNSSTSLLDTISRNPLPAAVAILGATWLFLKNRDENRGAQNGGNGYNAYLPSGSDTDITNNGSRLGDVVDTVKDRAGQVGDSVSGAVSSAKDKVGDAVDTAKDRVGTAVGTAKDKVGDVVDSAKGAVSTVKDRTVQMTGQARDRVSDLGSSALEHTRRAGGAVSDTFQDNPMAYGLVALGIGAAVGLLIPATEPENRIMGQKRDELMGRAQSAAQDMAQKVQHVAEETLDAAKTTATQEAKNQGLTGE